MCTIFWEFVVSRGSAEILQVFFLYMSVHLICFRFMGRVVFTKDL